MQFLFLTTRWGVIERLTLCSLLGSKEYWEEQLFNSIRNIVLKGGGRTTILQKPWRQEEPEKGVINTKPRKEQAIAASQWRKRGASTERKRKEGLRRPVCDCNAELTVGLHHPESHSLQLQIAGLRPVEYLNLPAVARYPSEACSSATGRTTGRTRAYSPAERSDPPATQVCFREADSLQLVSEGPPFMRPLKEAIWNHQYTKGGPLHH